MEMFIFAACIYNLIAMTTTAESPTTPPMSACAGVPDGHFVRNAASCQSYHYCQRDEASHSDRCPGQMAFNAQRQACDQPARVDCLQCSGHGVQLLADPDDCRQYYACVMGERSHRTCDVGLAFDVLLGVCNLAGRVKCSEQSGRGALSGICAQFRHRRFIHVGVPDDCARYVTCLHGVGYARKCPSDLYFNAFTGKCALPGAFNFCQTSGSIVQQSAIDDRPVAGTPWNAELMPTKSPPQSPSAPPQWQPNSPGNQQQPEWQPQPQWQPQPEKQPQSQPQPQPQPQSQPQPQPQPQPQAPAPPSQVAVPPAADGTRDPDPVRCVKRAGYNLIAGSGCQQYVYCIKGVVRFEMKCEPQTWYNLLSEKCERDRPVGC